VTLLRVVAVDLLACLSDLLRDDESFAPLDDKLDPWIVVAFGEREAISLT
jgi:hypothetical protein